MNVLKKISFLNSIQGLNLNLIKRSKSIRFVRHDDIQSNWMKIWNVTFPISKGKQLLNIASIQNQLENKIQEVVDFPKIGIDKQMFNGQLFHEIPILEMILSKNNSRLTCYDHEFSRIILKKSCNTEGFKNSKKGTTVASYTVGYNMGKYLQVKGIKQVRVALRGLGNGRKSSIQGLEFSGCKIISITDLTNYNPYPKRRASLPLRR